MNKTVLVVAAHPDDEVLGCGGTIAKHSQEGNKVHVVIMAEGVTSRDNRRSPQRRAKQLSRLSDDAHRANDLLSVDSLTLHDFPDNRMDSADLLDVVKVIEDHIFRLRPECVYTHHAGDTNVDHRRIHQAVVTACRPQPRHPVKTLLFFEIASSTEWQTAGSEPTFMPNWFVDISATLELKLRALQIYSSEMREWPHARSIRALEYLSKWRGATIGVEAAEAFQLGRRISI